MHSSTHSGTAYLTFVYALQVQNNNMLFTVLTSARLYVQGCSCHCAKLTLVHDVHARSSVSILCIPRACIPTRFT